MIICLLELEVKIMVEKDFVKIFFEKWVKLGYFLRILVKGFNIIIWIWNLYVDVYDFDSYINDLEEIFCKVFSVYFG
ncbi:hypothetical protein GCM10010495_82550 [Kitasatospora herbaricolor]|nr:hypothetical protein GCM10010495_82550 [Kitasatospora herbaricolor]